jgi:hypothetical protein
MSVTPEMGLILPEVMLTLGPQYASMLNTALEVVSAHTHVSGSGNPVPTAGIQLNADLTFNSFAATDLERTAYTDQIAALTDVRSVYTVNGDLYYTNTAGDQVQITAGNSIAGTPGAITGLGDGGSSGVYYDATETLSFYYNGTAQAKLDISTIQIHPFEIAAGPTPVPHPEYIALIAPISLAASYDITLPDALPAQAGMLSMDGAGEIGYGMPDGTVTLPGLSFSSESGTGIYRSGAGALRVSVSGAQVASFSANAIRSVDGTTGTPAFSFLSDTNTGIRLAGSDRIGFVLGGTQPHVMSATQILSVGAGAAAPTYSFEADTDTGMYQVALDVLGFTAGGTKRFEVNGNQFLSASSGTAANPNYSWDGDTDTGMYRVGANQIGFATNGTSRMTISAAAVDTPLSFTATGAVRGGTGVSAGSTADLIKWEVFTGTLASSATTTLIVSGSIVGCVGFSEFNGTSDWVNMEGDATSSTSNSVRFNGGTSGKTDRVQITNRDTNSSNDYRVTVFYQ